MAEFVALKPVYSRGDGNRYAAGQTFNGDHLTAGERDMLIAMEVIKPVEVVAAPVEIVASDPESTIDTTEIDSV